MRKPDALIVDGRAFSWRRLVELRRQQLAAWQEAHAQQLALFELRHDCRPRSERTASRRYEEPNLFVATVSKS